MQVRHDAPIEVTIKSGHRVLSRETVTADLVNTHLTVQTALLGGVSGHVNWNYQGEVLNAAPKASLRLVDQAYALKDGELCMCSTCKAEETA